ncbi:hypothetical protein F5144DRAFT_564794 [Chaetomium tenue]|uniref:Uncharacterized protein n=1 Tax=Chaetomium tenue TaxID=1854479 RepID=A0ACB7PIV1_9PEZI|nr:hypothetical protein F5144DRAFT_564794 [Chaetomium globosum]
MYAYRLWCVPPARRLARPIYFALSLTPFGLMRIGLTGPYGGFGTGQTVKFMCASTVGSEEVMPTGYSREFYPLRFS